MAPEEDHYARTHREIAELRQAILSCKCDYCDAQPGNRCETARGMRRVQYTTPHMVRVKTGHKKWKNERQWE